MPSTTQPVVRPRVLLLGWITAVIAFAVDAYLPALPGVARDLHTSTSLASFTLTSLLVGLAVGQLLGGPWSDAVGRRRPILVGLAGYAVTSALCAVAPTVEALIAFRFVEGVLGSLCIVAGRAVVRDCWVGHDAARVFSRLLLVLGAAPIAAPMVGALVLRVTSWRGVFIVLTGLGVVLLTVTLRGLPETLPEDRRHTGGLASTLRTFGVLLHDPHYVLVVLAGGVGYGSLFVYLSGSSFTLQDLFGLSPTQYALCFGANGLGFVASSQLGGSLVRRTGARSLLLTGAALQSAAGLVLLVGAAAGAGLPSVLAGFFLVTVSVGLIPPNATALALADHAAHAGAAAALLGLVSQLVAGVIAPIVGVTGAPRPWLLGLLVLVCGSLCFLLTLMSHARARTSAVPEIPL